MIIKYSGKNLARICEAARSVLQRGGIIVYPTDTVYGFGVDATNKSAVEKLRRLKKTKQPFSVMVANFGMLGQHARLSTEQASIVRKKFPGPYTLILRPRKQLFVSHFSVGFRIPRHWCVKISRRLGKPVTSTSANVHEKPTPTTIAGIKKAFGNKVGLYIDAGALRGKPSTIIDFTASKPKVIRK